MREYIAKFSDEFVKQMKDKGMTDEFELIRCKDCTHFGYETIDVFTGRGYRCVRVSTCDYHGGCVEEDDYCSRVKRKEE